jgi:enamine deaminase RidA (YjgF/YER057c/UK114 family)
MRPSGYSNGTAAAGRMVFVAGQVGWHPVKGWESDDFVHQVRQCLENTRAVLEAGGARPEHIVRMTWYVTDKQEYLANLKGVGEAYRAVLGKVFPAMALVQVAALVEDRAKVEIETTAIVG